MKVLRALFITFALLSSQHAATAQQVPARDNATKKAIIVSALAAQQVLSFYVEYKWWWEGDYHPFAIFSDGWFDNYSLGIDKAGHFYTSYLYFTALNEIFKWGGFSDRTRMVTSVALPFFYALSIELGDGFSSYNFSPQDLLMNSMGIGYGLLQDKLPVLRNFNFKMSYFPSQRQFDNHFKKWALTSDYDGHIYWLTVNTGVLFKSQQHNRASDFINIGFGYGINNFASGHPLEREFMLGIDYNLAAIHTNNAGARMLLNIFDKVHIPAPGLKRSAGHTTPEWLILN
jgi:hypothetical protein